MAVRVLLVLAALSLLIAISACGEAAQESEPKPRTNPEPTTPGPLEYGDPVELIGIPWSGPQQIDYEGRQVLIVIFQYAEGPGAEQGDRFIAVAGRYGGQAASELRAAGVASRQAEPPEYRLEGTYEGWLELDDGREYEALMVESAEPEKSN
jgi:hypothetical protein